MVTMFFVVTVVIMEYIISMISLLSRSEATVRPDRRALPFPRLIFTAAPLEPYHALSGRIAAALAGLSFCTWHAKNKKSFYGEVCFEAGPGLPDK